MRITPALGAAAAVVAALSLAACKRPTGTAPQGSDVAAAMPDTSAPKGGGPMDQAPDAGATGQVSANPAVPPAKAPEPATPPGTAGDGRVDSTK